MNYIGLKLLLGAFIFLPNIELQAVPLRELRWVFPDPAIALPFLLIGVTQLVGLILDNKALCVLGAGAGIGMWGWLLWNSWLLGVIASFVFPCAIMGILASMLMIYRAVSRLRVQ